MFLQYVILLLFFTFSQARKHTLEIRNDFRYIIRCSLFGYEPGSFLLINATNIDSTNNQFVFVLDKTLTSGLSSYRESKLAGCSDDLVVGADNLALLKPVDNYMEIVKHGHGINGLRYYPPHEEIANSLSKKEMLKSILSQEFVYLRPKEIHDKIIDKITNDLLTKHANQRELLEFFSEPNQPSKISQLLYFICEIFENGNVRQLREVGHPKALVNSTETTGEKTTKINVITVDPIVEKMKTMIDTLKDYYYSDFLSLRKLPLVVQDYEKLAFSVKILFPTIEERGLYGLFIHNCPKPISTKHHSYSISLTVSMIEKNQDSYLSSGECRLPSLYTALCIVYFVLSIVWIVYLRISKRKVNIIFKLHYLMFGVLFTKAVSLTFHAINFHMIGVYGVHERGWAIMYYITHMIRGALFFITILLIGAGWAFIKHMLTNRERTVFMIVVPLQILANVAAIVIDESEEGTMRYSIWKEIFLFVDLACCAAILFPVIWSIKHLKSASQIDDKALSSLGKLRLFRQFYIMVISYVYLTRIIVYLLSITVPFNLTWVVEAFKEIITLAFIIAVGVKFRPVENNPYLQVSTDEDEEETVMERVQMEEIWSQSGITDGVSKKLSTRITEDDLDDDMDADDFVNDEKAKLIRTKYN